MIKTILVPATGAGSDDVAFPAALAVARQLTSHLDFLHVRQDISLVIGAMGDVQARPKQCPQGW